LDQGLSSLAQRDGTRLDGIEKQHGDQWVLPFATTKAGIEVADSDWAARAWKHIEWNRELMGVEFFDDHGRLFGRHWHLLALCVLFCGESEENLVMPPSKPALRNKGGPIPVLGRLHNHGKSRN